MQRLPILLVTHYEDDHSWGFQSDRAVTTEDAQVVAMKTILEIDPSVAEIASLAPGYSAVRESVGSEWKITKDEWTRDEQ
jgi:metal-dependent hydrolase (beta-lactamase superfamily II)